MKELEDLKKEEKKLRKEMYENAEKAKSAQCLMESIDGEECRGQGNQVCENVVNQKGYETDICLERSNSSRQCEAYEMTCLESKDNCVEWKEYCKREELVCYQSNRTCIEWGDPICLQERNIEKSDSGFLGIGATEYVDKGCDKWSDRPCTLWEDVCLTEKDLVCVENGRDCTTYEKFCTKEERQCVQWAAEFDCLRYKVIPSGLVCKDEGYEDACVATCAGAERIRKTIGMVLQHSIMLETRGMTGDKKTTELLRILTLTANSLKNMSLRIEKSRESTPVPNDIDMLDASGMESTEFPQFLNDLDEGSGSEPTELFQLLNGGSGSEPNDVDDSNVDVSEDLDLLKKTLLIQVKQLSIIAVKNELAEHSAELFSKFLKSVEKWTEGGKFARLSETDVEIVVKFIADLENEIDVVEQVKKREDVDVGFNADDVSGAKLVANLADEYLTTKTDKIKKDAQVHLLSSFMLQNLEDLATTKIDIHDYNQTLSYLLKCSKHLKNLREVWGEIKTFFVNVKQMGSMVRDNAKTVNDQKEILISFSADSKESADLVVGMIMNTIRESTIRAFSLNVYIIEVSSFYRKIMQRGLLKKIRGLHFEKCYEENCVDNIRQFILAEAEATAKYIQEEIRKVFIPYF